jgi:hypothetical protein
VRPLVAAEQAIVQIAGHVQDATGGSGQQKRHRHQAIETFDHSDPAFMQSLQQKRRKRRRNPLRRCIGCYDPENRQNPPNRYFRRAILVTANAS